MVNDPIGDMLTRIRNAQAVGIKSISIPASTMRERVLKVMKDEGYIRDYHREGDIPCNKVIIVEIKYKDGEPVIRELKRISKPGRRVFSMVADLPTVFNGLGVAIVSTSHGVMSDAQARAANIGGEVLCTVF
jgi:small subunit ribosomal protein S8